VIGLEQVVTPERLHGTGERPVGGDGLAANHTHGRCGPGGLELIAVEGRLTRAELAERIDVAYAAKTRADLRDLAGDLPGAISAQQAHRTPAITDLPVLASAPGTETGMADMTAQHADPGHERRDFAVKSKIRLPDYLPYIA
jgi:DUF1707 SHOCT-like domain